jgi:hypothetical protein
MIRKCLGGRFEARAGQPHDGLRAASPKFIELNETGPLTSKKIILFKKKNQKYKILT